MTVESPPPPPLLPTQTIYSYASYVAMMMPVLVFVGLVAHCVILIGLKALLYPSGETTTNIIRTTTNLISGAEQTSWLKSSWAIYFLSAVAGFLYFGWYGVWVVDQATYEGDDAEVSSGTFLRDEKGHGTTMDFAAIIFATGIAVANLVQLFVSGKFVIETQSDMEAVHTKDMTDYDGRRDAVPDGVKFSEKAPMKQMVDYNSNASKADLLVLATMAKYTSDRKMALLVRVLGSLLLVAAASLRADMHFAFQLAIIGGLMISFMNVVRFFVRVSLDSFDCSGNTKVLEFLMRVFYALAWPLITVGLTLLYNVNQLGYDPVTGLRDTTMLDNGHYTTGVALGRFFITLGMLFLCVVSGLYALPITRLQSCVGCNMIPWSFCFGDEFLYRDADKVNKVFVADGEKSMNGTMNRGFLSKEDVKTAAGPHFSRTFDAILP